MENFCERHLLSQFVIILVDGARLFLRSSDPQKDYINASFVDVSKNNRLVSNCAETKVQSRGSGE